jgi:translocation and assembly module TamA
MNPRTPANRPRVRRAPFETPSPAGAPAHARRFAWGFGAAVLALWGATVRAAIGIDIQGVEPDVRRNVQIFLSLERYKDRDDIDEALFDRLVDRAPSEVAAALRPFGFYEPQVRTENSRSSDGMWRTRIVIEPGPPIVVGEVEVSVTGAGADTPAFRGLTQNLPVREGDRLNHAAYDSIKGALQRTAANLGYIDAKLTRSELLVDPAARRATVTLALETGPRFHFGATAIEQTVVNETLLRKFLRYEQDDPFDANELLRTQFALDDSQYFATVEVLPGEPDRNLNLIPVTIRAEANRRNRYSFGVGYGTDTRARGTATWENRRINARGHRLRADLKAAETRQSVEARYVIPIGDPALEKLSTEFSYTRDVLGDLDTRATKVEPSVTHVRGKWQRVLFTRFTRLTTILEPPAPAVSTEIVDTLAIPGLSFASVPQGYLGEALFSRALFAELRGSTPSLGAATSYVQLRVEAERVFDLRPAWHLLLRGQLGASLIDDKNDLAGTERFFAGGDRSVRGFGLNDLSPLDASGARVGARHAFAATAEVIRDLPRNFGAAAFVDVGNAFDRFGDPLQYSVGLGFRWRLPVVTIGVDVAQPLTNPRCRAAQRDPRCVTEPGFDETPSPRLHLNFSPKL